MSKDIAPLFNYFKINTRTCLVSGIAQETSGKIEIPGLSPDGCQVVGIANSAFKGNLNITEVVLPESIERIGTSAFENCKNLTCVSFPTEIITIGNKAFKRCNLKNVHLPKISVVDFAAFSYNSEAIITIEKEIDHIKSHAFNGCKEIICTLSKTKQNLWDTEWNAGLGATDRKKQNDEITEIFQANQESTKNAEKSTSEQMVKSIRSKCANEDLLGISYTKIRKLSFPIKKLSFKNIPVLKSVQLSFYEKYIILLLQTGIYADDKEQLVAKVSSFLNVSERCVLDFIDYLINTKALRSDRTKNLFKLDESIHYSLNKSLNNAMFAEVELKQADCNNIVFVEKALLFLLDEDFSNNIFVIKDEKKQTPDSLPYSVQAAVLNHANTLKPLFERYFSNTNMHLTEDFSFELRPDKYSECVIEFDAILEYKYVKSENRSIRQKTIVQSNIILPDEFVDDLASQFDTDDELPKFIKLQDFYEGIIPTSSAMTSIDAQIEKSQDNITPLEREINEEKAVLLSIGKQHAKEKRFEEEKAEELREKIEKVQKEISINEAMVSDKRLDDTALVKNLKNAIKELLKSQKTLSDQLESQEKNIAEVTEEFANREAALKNSIKQKEEEITNINKTIVEYKSQHKTIAQEQQALLSQNEKMLNPIIKSVIENYPASENIMFRFVSDVCLWLDSAVSASECDSYDEICRSVDFIRETYRKLLHAVFDVCLKTKTETLGVYLSDPFHIIKIDDMFRKRNVALDIKNQLIKLHSLANAIGHSTENGPKKHDNIRRVEGFKALTVKEREKILLAIPNFFGSIKFTKEEIREISSLLKI